jgi:hypothetical protein
VQDWLRPALFIWITLAMTGPIRAATIRIPSEQATIQAGIAHAVAGDTVLVAPGTYEGPGNRDLDFGGVDIVLRSEAGANATVIECGRAGRGFLFHSGESNAAVLDGLTITGGRVQEDNGAAIHCVSSSPTIQDCVLTANETSSSDLFYGGAVYCSASSAQFLNCEFTNNASTGPYASGGAMYLTDASPSITGCSFSGNHCDFRAAGIHVWGDSSPVISGCTFAGNDGGPWGGALSTMDGPSPVIRDCTFTQNDAGNGAGIYSAYSSPEIVDCVFLANHATSGGGGVSAEDPSSPSFTRVLFVGNSSDYSGGALDFAWNSPLVVNCTLYGNSSPHGAGIRCYGSSCAADVRNSIVASSTEGPAIYCENNAIPTYSHCCIYGNEGGDGLCGTATDNILEDPEFCGATNGDFQISDGSPCAPAGNPWGELVGAYGTGCLTAAKQSTWGSIKLSFR